MKMNEILKAAAESFPNEKRPEIAVAKYFQAYKKNADAMLKDAEDAIANIERFRQMEAALKLLQDREDEIGQIANRLTSTHFSVENFSKFLDQNSK